MDVLARRDLLELLERASAPALSIYMPTHRTGAETDADRLRLRAALRRARELLAPERGKREIEELLEPLEPLAASERFWRRQADGLALFRCPGFFQAFRLPAKLADLVVVGANFHTRPLLRYLELPDRYWVLMLSEKEVRLWQGSAARLTPVDPEGIPGSLTEGLGTGFERDYPIVVARKDMTGRHGGPGARATMPVFHGHGVGPDDSEPEMRTFFRRVDDALRERLAGDPSPVVLAAPEERHALFRAVSRLPNLAAEGIVAGVRDWSDARLHATSWPIACRAAEREAERGRTLWERGVATGKTESDPVAVGRLAIGGRVRLLMTERDRRLWGSLDRETGELRVVREGGDDPGADSLDVVDEISEVVLLRGGDVVSVPAGRMPTPSALAAVLR